MRTLRVPRRRLPLLLVATLVIASSLAAFGAYSTNRLTDESERLRLRDRLSMVGAVAESLDGGTTRIAVTLIDTLPLTLQPNSPEDQAMLQRYSKPITPAVAVLGLDGTLLNSAGLQMTPPPADDPGYARVRQELAAGRPGALMAGTSSTGAHLLGFGRYAMRDGKPAAVRRPSIAGVSTPANEAMTSPIGRPFSTSDPPSWKRNEKRSWRWRLRIAPVSAIVSRPRSMARNTNGSTPSRLISSRRASGVVASSVASSTRKAVNAGSDGTTCVNGRGGAVSSPLSPFSSGLDAPSCSTFIFRALTHSDDGGLCVSTNGPVEALPTGRTPSSERWGRLRP